MKNRVIDSLGWDARVVLSVLVNRRHIPEAEIADAADVSRIEPALGGLVESVLLVRQG